MAEVHHETLEINEIIAGMNNIPIINAVDSDEDGCDDSDDEENPAIKRTRTVGPARPRMTTSRSFTQGSSNSAAMQDTVAEGEETGNLGIERQSRSTSPNPTGSFPRTQSPSDNAFQKNYYRDALLRESYNSRVSFMRGSWLLEKAAARRALITDMKQPPKTKLPHGTKRKNNTESYDSGFLPSSPGPSTSQQA